MRKNTHLLEAVSEGMKASGLGADIIEPIVEEAEDGNPAAEFIVASALETSAPAEALEWYRKAAEQGYRPARAVLDRLQQLAA